MVSSSQRRIDHNEKIQSRFTEHFSVAYNKPLRLAQLPGLEIKRIQNDLICFDKIIFGLNKISYPDFFEFRLRSTGGHSYVLTFSSG